MEVEIPRFWAWIATHSLTRSFYGGSRPKKKSAEAMPQQIFNKLKKKLYDGECHHARFHTLVGSFDVVVESN